VAIGNRDIENGTVEVARRDTLSKEIQPIAGISEYINNLLDTIQTSIYEKAKSFQADNTFELNTWEEFTEQIEKGGFISAHWDGTDETEDKIKELTKATIRCIPIDVKKEEGSCVLTGKPSSHRVIFAKAY
jgi:prolyl-tRNA synthetase